jgi:hypothetical protein
LGAGKTQGAVKYCYDLQKADPRYILYTNVRIKEAYPFEWKPIEFEELFVKALAGEDFDDPFIIWLFDEIGNYFDARTPGDTKARIFTYFITQLRKRKSHFVYTGKDAMLTDIRLRDNTGFLIEASKRETYNPRIECDDPECPNKHYFRYEIWKILKTTKRLTGNYWIANPEFYFDMYDSFHIPAPGDIMSKEQIARIAPRITNLGLSQENRQPSVINLG